MGSIILFALAAAIYPQLLAVVVIILTRPSPQPLLWACWLTGMMVSVGSSIVIFTVFRSRDSIAGTTSHRIGPAVYLSVGVIAVLIAMLLATPRGRDLLERRPAVIRSNRGARSGSTMVDKTTMAKTTAAKATVAKTRARAEQALGEGSLVVACVIGGLLALPGPFDLLAVGHLARGGYGLLVATGVMVAFALVKFALIEIPITGYLIDPDGTAATVSRFNRWMQANKVVGVAAVVGLVGIVLIGRGASGVL